MKNLHQKFSLCLLILLLLTQAACDSWATIKGTVYDSQNNPLENATIQLKIADSKEEIYQRTVRTNKDGGFDVMVGFGGLFNVDLRLVAAKDGYKIYEEDLSAKEIQKNQSKYNDYKIVLEKIQ